MPRTLPKPKFELMTVAPRYGQNYRRGDIGFTYHNDNVIAIGIAWFTKWARMSDICATHALIVTGENSCIEADAGEKCVKVGTLDHYFNEPHCQIFFRKPQGLTDEIADRIVQVATPTIGQPYDFRVILMHAIVGTFAGHLLNRLTEAEFEAGLAKLLNTPDQWICSELAAYALDEQPEYRDRGVLRSPNATISPQELFEDLEIFEPWKP